MKSPFKIAIDEFLARCDVLCRARDWPRARLSKKIFQRSDRLQALHDGEERFTLKRLRDAEDRLGAIEKSKNVPVSKAAAAHRAKPAPKRVAKRRRA